MTPSLVAAGLWVLAANLVALLPPGRGCRTGATLLVLAGVPLLGWLTYQNGPWIGLAALTGGAATLRWPLHLPRHRRAEPPLPPPGPAE